MSFACYRQRKIKNSVINVAPINMFSLYLSFEVVYCQNRADNEHGSENY